MLLKEKDLLRELVRIPSINPALAGDRMQGVGEEKLSDFLTNFFDMNGWPWLRQAVHPGRANLIAVSRSGSSNPGGGVLLWEAHQDTVGVEGMQIDPFAGIERDGRIDVGPLARATDVFCRLATA